jgi:hypothetical protein
MIINMSSVKTEALLLFCRDLIDSYKNNTNDIYNINEQTVTFIEQNIVDLNKAINVIIQENDYYIKNLKVSRIKIIVSFYNIINNTINKHLKKNNRFNPAMLCFSLLATWFKELEHQGDSKEYLYFNLYPYSDIFDILIVKVDNKEYKQLNISMVEIAENVMIQLNNKALNGI